MSIPWDSPAWLNTTGVLVCLAGAGLVPVLVFRRRLPKWVRRLYVAVVVAAGLGLAPPVAFVLLLRALRKHNVW